MKLAYVLPKYDEGAGEHFFHIYKLLGELGKKAKLAVLIEKNKGKPHFENAKTVLSVNSQSFIPRFF